MDGQPQAWQRAYQQQQAWQRAYDGGYVLAYFGTFTPFSADNALRLAECLIARAEAFRVCAQHNHCTDKVDAGPMRVALQYEALAYALL